MMACTVEPILSCHVITQVQMTGQVGYQKLYFENSTYKYYVRKHMQVLIQKVSEYFQQRSGKVIAAGWENGTLLNREQNHNVCASQVTVYT